MKFLLYIIIIELAILCFAIPHPGSPSSPKTLEEAIKLIQNLEDKQKKLDDKQKKLDNEIKEIYKLIVDNNDDILITYKPEVIEWMRKLNQQNEQNSAPIVVNTPCFRFIRFPSHWNLGHQIQGYHPGLVVKYSKDFTRALVFPVSHVQQYNDHAIPIRLPNDQGRTSYILVDQFQNVCGRNIGPAIIGALDEKMWNTIYKNYPFLKDNKR